MNIFIRKAPLFSINVEWVLEPSLDGIKKFPFDRKETDLSLSVRLGERLDFNQLKQIGLAIEKEKDFKVIIAFEHKGMLPLMLQIFESFDLKRVFFLLHAGKYAGCIISGNIGFGHFAFKGNEKYINFSVWSSASVLREYITQFPIPILRYEKNENTIGAYSFSEVKEGKEIEFHGEKVKYLQDDSYERLYYLDDPLETISSLPDECVINPVEDLHYLSGDFILKMESFIAIRTPKKPDEFLGIKINPTGGREFVNYQLKNGIFIQLEVRHKTGVISFDIQENGNRKTYYVYRQSTGGLINELSRLFEEIDLVIPNSIEKFCVGKTFWIKKENNKIIYYSGKTINPDGLEREVILTSEKTQDRKTIWNYSENYSLQISIENKPNINF